MTVVAEDPHASGVLDAAGARVLTEQIRSAVVRTIDVLGEVDHLVVRAFEGRAWVALEYESWEAYVGGEFSQARLWESVEQRQTRAATLRDAGLSSRAVAAVLGVGKSTVHRDLEVLSGVPGGAPDSRDAGEGVAVGIDGKSYPRRAASPRLRERTARVVELRGAGLTQVQIAAELGVAQSTVSAYLSAAAARGALDPVMMLGVPVGGDRDEDDGALGAVVEVSRAGALLAEARARAGAVSASARQLREGVVDADEWTGDPLLAAEVAEAVGPVLARAAGDLEYVLAHLDVPAAVGHVPPSARVHVARARRVRQIAVALDEGVALEAIAASLGVEAEVVAKVAASLVDLDAGRRSGLRGAGGGPGNPPGG
ncbi:hypothetical protein AGMMS50218_15330 [Actinomycetota bacterium]|nr:hypothetical protein AGMMS50218_15330 [Actinomycetota bacterium]